MEVLKFSSKYCVPCKMYDSIFKEVCKNLSVGGESISIDTPDSKLLVDMYEITSVPTTVIIDGNSYKKKSGLLTKDALTEFINE